MEPTWQSECGTVQLYLGDCLDVLPHLEGVDAVVTDPPYGLGSRWARKSHGRNGESRLWTGKVPEWDVSVPQERISAAIATAERWIVWGAYNAAMPAASGTLVWDKIQETSRSEGEAALTNAANGVRFFRMSRIDAYVNEAPFKKEHPCEKPVQLMDWCISFLPDAETILDPFMGSGTTGVACARLGRRFIGIEIEPRYFAIAKRRIQEALHSQPLFAGQA